MTALKVCITIEIQKTGISKLFGKIKGKSSGAESDKASFCRKLSESSKQ